MRQKLIIFDTTLRDGEQSLQASLTVKEKVQIALALERMNIDVIEVGFPISSPGDFKSVQAIAKKIKNIKLCALARCVKKDIDAAYQALSITQNFRIHVFIPCSPIQITTKLRSTLNEVINHAVNMVKYARNYTDDVQFSCEDSGRAPILDVCRMVESTINAGATTINIPDTVGYTFPNEYSNIFKQLINNVPNIDKITLSSHTHNDLGMATGNAISAIQCGAYQIEGTINGIGERAGNCALEEIIMIIKTREKDINLYTDIKCKEIYRTSQLVSQICNLPIPANKAIVGSNAFTHSAGIHQDGILKNYQNYEILIPESIGLNKISLNLTSRSGRAAVKHCMEKMGYKDQDYNLNLLYQSFLKLADKKGQVFDYDLEALAFINNQNEEQNYYKLDSFNVASNLNCRSTASVSIFCDKDKKISNSLGNGPIDAIYRAINKIVKFNIELIDYKLNAKGHGENALGEAHIIIYYNERKFHGIGLSTDIIEASVKAMINSLNNLWRSKQVAKELKIKFDKRNINYE